MALAVRAVASYPELEESRRDLVADFDELTFVAASAAERLESALAELEAAQESVTPAVAGRVRLESRALIGRLGRRGRELEGLAEAAAVARDARELAALTAARGLRAELLRSELALVGALVTASDWQSPSFGHSLRSAAGRQTGLIEAHRTDYKRDRHLDAEAYERAYVREFVGRSGARALMTSCGMSAFTTIVGFLLGEGKLRDRYVVVGRGLYHETKQLLYGAIPRQVIETDELIPESIALAVEKFRPAAVFFDSVSNTARAPVIDPRWLFALLSRGVDGAYAVVDATGTTVAALPPLPATTDGVHVVLFESLLKYCQLGLDRANAGIVVAWGEDAGALSRYREHLGTNVPDVAVHVLPPPNRPLLLRRLARLERNARLVAERLEWAVEEAGRRVVEAVVSPLLPSHPCHARAARLPFAGSCLALRLAPGYEEPAWRERLLERALDAARRRGVSLIAGASFGFDTTRIYVTAASTEFGEPFVRIAVGAEHRQAIEELAEALAEAVAGLAQP
jgi:cystathionine beta-lyase/cystathionine gamma-synthase